MKPFWQSKRWTILIMLALVLLVAMLAGAPADAVTALAVGLGGAVSVFMGGESWADGQRRRQAPDEPKATEEEEHVRAVMEHRKGCPFCTGGIVPPQAGGGAS